MDKTILPVAKIQRFSVHDGPGIRTTVFFKGCPLKCLWCHNPETQSVKDQFFYTPTLCVACGACEKVCKTGAHSIINNKKVFDRSKCNECMDCSEVCLTGAIEKCSNKMSIEQIIETVKKDKAFYGKTGGITLSGGEPLFHGKNAMDLINCAKKEKLNVAIQTCGYFDENLIQDLKGKVDLCLFDIKDTDEYRHEKYTGVKTDKIIKNLFNIDKANIKTILRCIVVQGINDNKEHYDNVIKIYNDLKNCKRVEIFAHHSLGQGKYIGLNKKYLAEKEWSPDKQKMKEIKSYFISKNVKCKIIG